MMGWPACRLGRLQPLGKDWFFAGKCTARRGVCDDGLQALWIYRLMANGSIGYNRVAATEDTATVGTDRSAVAVPYGTGGIFPGAACFGFRGLVERSDLPSKRLCPSRRFPTELDVSAVM